jgi:hypothetical protein
MPSLEAVKLLSRLEQPQTSLPSDMRFMNVALNVGVLGSRAGSMAFDTRICVLNCLMYSTYIAIRMEKVGL